MKPHLSEIDAKAGLILEISHKVWEYAELSLKEYQSAALYMEKLAEEGFAVKKGYAGIETAFSGTFTSGSRKPVIGILGEFDALSGLSEKAGSVVREELVPGGSGHGCGHNMLGAGSFGAALGVKKYLEETGTDGRNWASFTAEMDVPVSGVRGVYFVFHAPSDEIIGAFDSFTFSK